MSGFDKSVEDRTLPMRPTETLFRVPGILRGSEAFSTTRSARLPKSPADAHRARFTPQSHALGGPVAQPRALFVAAAIVVVLFLLGRRLSQ